MNQSETQQAEPAVEPDTEAALSEEEIWEQLESEERAGDEPEPKSEKEDEPEQSAEESDDDDGQEPQGDPEPEPSTKGKEPPPASQAEEGSGQEEQPSITEEKFQEMWNQVPEALRNEIQNHNRQQSEAFHRMQQQYNALHGRVAPAQRQLAELTRERDELKKQMEAHQNAPSSLEELEKSKVFKDIAEDFPEDAKALREQVSGVVANAVQNATAKLEEDQRALQTERETWTQREIQRLEQAHPDWDQAVKSREFAYWRSALSPEHQQQVAQMLASPFAEENVQVLNAFKSDLQAAQQGSTQPQESKPQGSQQPSNTPSPQRRSPPSASPPSTGSGVSGSRRTPVARSEEDLFAEVDEAEMDAFARRGG